MHPPIRLEGCAVPFYIFVVKEILVSKSESLPIKTREEWRSASFYLMITGI